MTKEITIKIKYESNDEQDYTDTDEFIKHDLEQEIGCCSNCYDIESIDIKELH